MTNPTGKGLQSLFGPTTGRILLVQEDDGSSSLYLQQALQRFHVRLRNPDTNKVIPVMGFVAGAHKPEQFKRWNDTGLGALASVVCATHFRQAPAVPTQFAHIFELGMYYGILLERVMKNRGLVIEMDQSSVTAEEMDQVIEKEQKRNA